MDHSVLLNQPSFPSQTPSLSPSNSNKALLEEHLCITDYKKRKTNQRHKTSWQGWQCAAFQRLM